MSRFSRIIAFATLISFLGYSPAQGQASITIAPQDAILRVEENEAWIFWRDAAGTPAIGDNHQVQDGLPLVELNPSTQAHYEEHGVQDVFASYAELVPVSYAYESITTLVQTRVIRFADTNQADGYLNSVLDAQLEAVAVGEIEDRQFAPIDPLPEFQYPVVGWTTVTAYSGSQTGEPQGYASGVRYHSQIDNVIVSAEVIGPFADFNFDAAFWLLENQALCVQQETPCAPAPMPMGNADWLFIGDVLYFTGNDAGEGVEARWMYPVESAVRSPEMSATIIIEQGMTSGEPGTAIRRASLDTLHLRHP